MTTLMKVDPVAATLVNYLKTRVSSIPVATKFPTSGSRFIRVVMAGGGGRRDVVMHDATVAIECVASTYAQAEADMALADAHMNNAHRVGGPIRNVVQFAAPAELPIPDSPLFRLTATYQVTVKASALT